MIGKVRRNKKNHTLSFTIPYYYFILLMLLFPLLLLLLLLLLLSSRLLLWPWCLEEYMIVSIYSSPLVLQSRLEEKTTLILNNLPRERDCSPKRVDTLLLRGTIVNRTNHC